MAQSKYWCFTINNPTDEDERLVRSFTGARWCVWQLEKGENGTPHFQGYVVFEGNCRMAALKKKHSSAHWESRKGSHIQARDYCVKEDTRIDGPWTYGEEPRQGARNDLKAVATSILKEKRKWKDVCQEHGDLVIKYPRGLRCLVEAAAEPYSHDSVRGIWIYGPPGVGKSHYAHTTYPGAYRKAQNKWWDGYDSQEAVILDDLDTDCLSHYLKIWADKYACSGEVKGGTVELQHKVFIVTSNYSIEDLFAKDSVLASAIKRRFKVMHKVELAHLA